MEKTIYKFSHTDPIGTVHTFLVVEKGEEKSKCKIVNYDTVEDGTGFRNEDEGVSRYTVDAHVSVIANDRVEMTIEDAKEFGDDFKEISEKSFNYEMKSIAEKLGNYLAE